MNLIWHMFRKDLRHTRLYAAAWLAALLFSTWVDARIVSAHPDARSTYINFQLPADLLTFAALGLLCGVLFLAERVPGTRAYWLARPMQWRDLLLAKFLVLLAVAVLPVVALHAAVVAWRGFPLWDFAGALLWNGFWLVAVCAIPLAALASISRNLQELILWALALGGIGFAVRLTGPNWPRWGFDAVTLLVILAGCSAVMCWQYQSRRTVAGRWGTAAVCAAVGALAYLPEPVWARVQTAVSPVKVKDTAVTIVAKGGQPMYWVDSKTLGIGDRGFLGGSIEVTGLPDGWSAELTRLRVERLWKAGEADAQDTYIKGWLDLKNQGGWNLSSPYLKQHSGQQVNVDIVADLLIRGSIEGTSLPVNTQAYVQDVGWCRAKDGELLRVECESVLRPQRRMQASWGNVALINEVEQADQVPAGAVPSLHPIRLFTGVFGGGGSFASKPVRIKVSKAMAYLQRRQELRDVPLLEIKDR